ncbi:uncharacterized protein LOC135343755 isoform X2 [Halichondria panicea]|uniref:uncharacterized protein LOC135343755 isoform X2 n=1 Tax=Halichondria panicea TaxID=6063 RepID=UPI00312BB0D3
MECHGDDLCTLQELSDSNLLSCLESRYMRGIQHAHIGRNVSLYLSPSTHTIPVQANRLAANILHDLKMQEDDQCLLLYGCKAAHKTAIFQSVVASLLSQASSKHTGTLMAAVQLLSLLTSHEGLPECVLTTSLYVDPATMETTGGHFSCMLLNTKTLNNFEVLAHNEVVREKLEELGMPLPLRDNYLALMSAVRLLLEGGEASSYLGVQLHTESGTILAQQLYTYLVAWTVSWLNSELAPPPTETPRRVLCVNQPGMWTDSYRNTLPDLVGRYCSEALHNLYCQRLFVWEQEQYEEEGVEWETVPVEFNQTLMDTFHKTDGLLQSVGLDSTHELLTALSTTCDGSGDTCYETDSDTFVVSHFTGEQSYVVTENWPRMNKLHSVSHDLTRLLRTSTNSVLQDISKMMMESSPDVILPDHAHSLTNRARDCMSRVCEEVTFCQPHFVLTLCTGEEETDKKFDSSHVLTQLQHLRVLDTALIQSCGYPVRISHDKFIDSYSPLLICKNSTHSPSETCRALIQAAQLEDYLVGSHQVLLKPWHLGQLQVALSVIHTSARKLQQAFRRSYTRRNSDRLRMEKALSMIRQPVISEDSDEDSGCSSPSSVTSIPPMSPSRASPASPKSPAKSGHAGAKKRSWGKDVRTSGPQAAATPSSPLHKHHSSYTWYHGMISRPAAEKALGSVKSDCFLVRESQNREGEHSLSLTHNGKVKHYRIDTKQGVKTRYELFGAKRSFLRLSELIDYYSEHCLSADGELLTTPCPNKDSSSDDDFPPPLPPPRRNNFSSIKRPQQSIKKLHKRRKSIQRSTTVGEDDQRGSAHPLLGATRPHSVDLYTADISDESISLLQKELEIEERIIEAARRLADIPCSKREKQRRKQSLQDAHGRLLMLRQQYHTLQERRRFIEMSMQNITEPHSRRVSMPLPPLPH